MKYSSILLLLTILLLQSCIGDDVIMDEVDPEIRIQNPIDSLAVNSTYQFEYIYLNNIGREEMINASWSSTNTDVIQIDPNGLAETFQFGMADIMVSYNDGNHMVSDIKTIYVRDTTTEIQNTQRSGTIASTGTYQLEGDFTLEENNSGELILSFADNYAASTSLPGLYIYMTNNPSTTSGALEIGAVDVFSGAHSYNLGNVGLYDYSHVLYYCKPFNVKVGDGEIF